MTVQNNTDGSIEKRAGSISCNGASDRGIMQKPGEPVICLVDAAPLLDDPELSVRLTAGISEARRAKYNALSAPKDRALSLAASLALDCVLHTAAGMREKDGAVTYSQLGAPTLPGKYISLSHSGMLAGAALSTAPCGLDIEQPRYLPHKRMLALSERFFSENDAETVRTADSIADAFFRIWTCREAFMKLTGNGFSMPRDSFCIDGNAAVSGEKIYPVRTYIKRGYYISVCSTSTLTAQLPEPIDPRTLGRFCRASAGISVHSDGLN